MSKIGVAVVIRSEPEVAEKFREMKECGFECCQLVVWNMSLFTDHMAELINAAVCETGVEVTALWCGWSGPGVWSFKEGPLTLGLVPAAYRVRRAEDLIKGAEFAKKIDVDKVVTHVGFIPENVNDPDYMGVVEILRYVVGNYKKLGVKFLFETGHETPVTLLRVIEELNSDNVGINMDTANLIIHGKANSADALKVFGKYVVETHIKDGLYPTSGMELGKEVKVGEGLADIPKIIAELRALGYTGNYIIEREISGEQQKKDIIDTFAYLKGLLGK